MSKFTKVILTVGSIGTLGMIISDKRRIAYMQEAINDYQLMLVKSMDQTATLLLKELKEQES